MVYPEVMMIDEKILSEMNLPLSNPKEELETISNTVLMPLLHPSKFEVRSEYQRDKGIDHWVEIKTDGRYTNFQFVIQLKATESTNTNSDGSFSLQIETSNINYLLNGSYSAYYVLYHKPTNQLFFEHLNEFLKKIVEKDANWNSQGSHVLRFSKILDEEAISEIYEATKRKGRSHRRMNEILAIKSATLEAGDRILIDGTLNVTDDSGVREWIMSMGLKHINEGDWKTIISLHKGASGNVATTAKYNLIVGVAYYYNAKNLEALQHFKAALRLKSELSEELLYHLRYFEIAAKYSIGIISEDEYERTLDELEDKTNIGLYIRIEKANKEYIQSLESGTGGYAQFVSTMQEILLDPQANINIKLIANCELMSFKGHENNKDFIRDSHKLKEHEERFGASLEARRQFAFGVIEKKDKWCEQVQLLKEAIKNIGNYFTFYLVMLHEIKIEYEFIVYSNQMFIVTGISAPALPSTLALKLNELEKAYEYFYSIGHIINVCAVLSLKYEMSHFLNELDIAAKAKQELMDIVDNYELREYKGKLDWLLNSGTTHERFELFLIKFSDDKNIAKAKIEKMKTELAQLEEIEQKTKTKIKEAYFIELFPIGTFEFPQSEKEKVYDIIGVKSVEAKEEFDYFFQNNIVPVANIYNKIIEQEGPLNGQMAFKGIDDYENIYRIRKELFANKFYRVNKLS